MQIIIPIIILILAILVARFLRGPRMDETSSIEIFLDYCLGDLELSEEDFDLLSSFMNTKTIVLNGNIESKNYVVLNFV